MSDTLRPSLSVTESLSRSWQSVTTNMGVMIGFTVLFYLASFIASRIPFLGFLTNLLSFVFTVSMFSAFHTISKHGNATFNDFFSWTPRFGKLLLAQLLLLAFVIAIFIPIAIILFATIGWTALAESVGRFSYYDFSGVGGGLIITMIVCLFIGLIVLAVFSFAFMYIVQFRNLSVWDSLRLSFQFGRNNFGNIIVFSLLAMCIALLGLLALIIGLLVAIPVIVGMQYYLLQSAFPNEETRTWDFMNTGKPEE